MAEQPLQDESPRRHLSQDLGPIDRVDLRTFGEAKLDDYRTAFPWPHLVLDDFIDGAVIARAKTEELAPALELIPRRSNRIMKAESPTPAGPTAKAILTRLLEPDVCAMLSTLTGISDLVADPTYRWGGVHVMTAGSFQAVHRDFAQDPTGDLWHRVNILVYLNRGWKPEWGGELELWDPGMTTCHRQIEPLGGRVIIFEPGPDALHGIPTVRCPSGEARLTLASYYYSRDPGPHAGRRHSQVVGLPRRPGEGILASLAIPFDPLRRFKERHNRAR